MRDRESIVIICIIDILCRIGLIGRICIMFMEDLCHGSVSNLGKKIVAFLTALIEESTRIYPWCKHPGGICLHSFDVMHLFCGETLVSVERIYLPFPLVKHRSYELLLPIWIPLIHQCYSSPVAISWLLQINCCLKNAVRPKKIILCCVSGHIHNKFEGRAVRRFFVNSNFFRKRSLRNC